ncbi:MAG: acyl-CoA thioesterase [Calditrichaeota bacterium]|nr:acyl-CoA thioesterase [Calditrichota bacterium]
MQKFSLRLKVRSYELDSQGHVNYAVYLNYCEYCRVEFMEQANLPFSYFMNQGKYIVIAEVHAKYISPAFLGDELDVTLETVELKRSSMTLKQEIFNTASGKKVFSATMRGVFINKQGRPIPMDEKFRQLLIGKTADN